MTIYTISSGEILSGTTLLSNSISVGTVNILNGDTVVVSSGGFVENISAMPGLIKVANGGSATSIEIASGGAISAVAGAVLSNDTVLTGGILYDTGATNNNTGLTVSAGGILDVTGTTGSQTIPVTVAAGSEIEFGGIPTSGVIGSSTSNGNTVLTFSGTALQHEQVVLSGVWNYTVDTSSGHDILTIVPVCYAEGTLIDTPTGLRAIEAIKAGDMVVVLRDGKRVAEAANWVGYSTIDLSRHAKPEHAAPIRIKAGALSENVPARDLVLSPEHCMILNGRAVPVKLLVNGGSIAREYPAAPFTYYHIELERHGILLAEGAESESYLDTGNRASFDNAGVPRVLHPTFEVNPTAARWATDACVPLAQVPNEVAPIWQTLAERSDMLGYKIPTPSLVTNPDVHLTVDGKRIQPTSDRKGRYVFMVPAGVKSVSLDSRFCIPADKMIPGMRDTRRLGVSVDWIAIRTTTTETILSADHPSLSAGWHDIERENETMWRWTDGSATIPWTNVEGSAVLTVKCTPVAEYPVYDDKLRLVA